MFLVYDFSILVRDICYGKCKKGKVISVFMNLVVYKI